MRAAYNPVTLNSAQENKYTSKKLEVAAAGKYNESLFDSNNLMKICENESP